MSKAVPTKLVVLSDLHLVPDGENILGVDPTARLRSAIAHIKRHQADADRVIIAGDLTHYGDEISYRVLKDTLRDLHIPVSVVLGNHDRREAFQAVFGVSHGDDNGFVQAALDVGNWRLLLLDTLDGPPYDHPHIHAGILCQKRLDWLTRRLEAAQDRPTMIIMHHPPHSVGFAGMDAIRLMNDTAFFATIETYRCVRHIVCGHIHRTISGSVRGIPFSIFKSPVHQQPMTFESEDTSLSVMEPAAYGILLLTETGVLVHTEDYEISSPIDPTTNS